MIGNVKFAFELYEKMRKNKEIKVVLRSNLYRELKFNLAILNEIEINKNKDYFIQLITLFKSDFYETLINSFIDIRNVIEEKKINIDKNVIENKNFLKWSSTVKTNIDLIEKIYFRIELLKSLSNIEISKRKDSYQYLKFLMLILKKELEND